jgi:hypothetical protein
MCSPPRSRCSLPAGLRRSPCVAPGVLRFRTAGSR